MTRYRLAFLSLVISSVITVASTPVVAQCVAPSEVLLNEIVYTPKTAAFIEIWGPPNTSLGCLKLVSANGGTDGTTCTLATVFTFDSTHLTNENGYFVLAVTDGPGVNVVTAKADLQDGPDGLYLAVADTDETIDSIAYGGSMDACDKPVKEGLSPAPTHASGESIVRLPDHVDTDENGTDWKVCTTPTPGAPNVCPQPQTCQGTPEAIVITELRVGPQGDEFVELSGPPGLALDCYLIRTRNGGTNGDQCLPELDTKLLGKQLNDQGLLVIDNLDLQKGPDGVELVYLSENGDVFVAGVVWKAPLSTCSAPMGTKSAVVVPPDGQSVSLCGTSGDDSKDFVTTAATPGSENMCPSPCTGPAVTVMINEIVVDPDDAAFVELTGTPGTDLSCYRLLEVNGGTSGADCKVETTVNLTGTVIPESGYLTIGKETVVGVDLVVSIKAQNGPSDGFRLEYAGTDATILVDSVVWGAAMPGCTNTTDVGFAPVAKKTGSITRCPDGVDSNNNSADFVISEEATPGDSNSCENVGPKVICDDPTIYSSIVINEFQTATAADAFVELYGPENTALSCLKLVHYNGGQAATSCDVVKSIPLSGTIGESGYFVIAPPDGNLKATADLVDAGADLQDGPDAVALWFVGNDGTETLLDSVIYGDTLPTCPFSEGEPAKKPGQKKSLTRCQGADTDNNLADFAVCTKPSPGEVTTCGCANAPTPGGGSGGVSEPGGCATHSWHSWGLLAFWLAALLMVGRTKRVS